MRADSIMWYLVLSLTGCGATPDHVASARAALESGDATTAAAEANLAVNESADQYAARKILAEAERELARQDVERGEFADAVAHLDTAIRAEPTPAARVEDALAAAQYSAAIQDSETQLRMLDLAIAANPSSLPARQAAASARDEVGDSERAIGHYLWLWDANPADLKLASRLGALYAQIGRQRDAAAVFGRILEKDPENVQAAFGRSDALIALSRMNEAERVLLALKKKYPTNPMVLYRWADLLEKTGRQAEADDVRKSATGELPGVKRRKMRKLR